MRKYPPICVPVSFGWLVVEDAPERSICTLSVVIMIGHIVTGLRCGWPAGGVVVTVLNQQELLDVADVAAGRRNGAVCTECRQLLDPALVAAGFSTHDDERQR